MPIIAIGSFLDLTLIIFLEIFLNGNCLRLSANFLIEGIKKNWPIKKNIWRKSNDLGENLKMKMADIIAKKVRNNFDLRISPFIFIWFARSGISGSFIKTNQLSEK